MDALRHVQIVQGLHGDGDVRDPLIDLLLRSRQRFITKDHSGMGIHPGGPEEGFPVPAYEPAKPLSPVDQEGLGPEVHQAVGGGRPSQADDPLYMRPDLPQCHPPLRPVVLEGRELIYDHHVEGPRHAVPLQVVDEPFHVLAVDHVHISGLLQCRLPALCPSRDDAHLKEGRVLPALLLPGPHRGADPKGGYHQYTGHFKAVEQKVRDGRQRYDRLAKPHGQDHHRLRVVPDETDAVFLVSMHLSSIHLLPSPFL